MNLGATELFHSVTLAGSGYIYPRVKFWKTFRTSLPALSLLCLPGSPDRPPRRQQPPVAGLRRRQWDRLCRCRRSKFIAGLGYELDLCVFLTPIPQHIALPCIVPRLRSFYPSKTLRSLVVN